MINRPILFKPRKPAFSYPYEIGYGGRFDNGTARMNIINTTTSSDTSKKTLSLWLKRGAIGTLGFCITSAYIDAETATGDYREFLRVRDTGEIQYFSRDNVGTKCNVTTVPQFGDPTHFFHLMLTIDADNATASERIKIYVNGVEQELTTTTAYTQYYDTYLFEESCRTLFGRDSNADQHWDGVMSEIHYLDGIVGDVNDFGEFIYHTWVPKEYTGSYGTNGLYLAMSNQADLGEDFSGNNNDMNAINVAASYDSPTTNYATLDVLSSEPLLTIGSGALVVEDTTAGGLIGNAMSTIGAMSGKWYVEAVLSDYAGAAALSLSVGQHPGRTGAGDIVDLFRYEVTANGTYRLAIDIDAGKVWTGSGSSWSGDPVAGTGGNSITVEEGAEVHIYVRDHSGTVGNGGVWTMYFGAEGFNQTQPTGYNALCAANLPPTDLAQIDGELGMWTNTREGTGAIVDVTGAPFDPSYGKTLVWIKNRDQADKHHLFDTVRGAAYQMHSNLLTANTANANGLTAFLSNGFSLGTGADGINDSAESFVDFVFKMAPEYGMDIVTFTGDGNTSQNIVHNLGEVPEMMIVKRLDDTSNWVVYHKDTSVSPETEYLSLNLSDLPTTTSTAWNDTEPTATVFTVGTLSNVNTATYIAYLFRSVPGFSRVGKWTDGGSADGARIYTGFKPKFLLYKRADTAVADWGMFDDTRQEYNDLGPYLYANKSDAEASTPYLRFLSNGFKRVSGTGTTKQVYLAIGRMPFPYCNAS